jgi:hypothetical protein
MASASSNFAGPRFGNGGVVSDNSPAPLLACFGALIAQEERGAASVKILISSLRPDMLAELVIVNMQHHLPSTAPPLPPGVGPGVSGGLACLLSSCPPECSAASKICCSCRDNCSLLSTSASNCGSFSRSMKGKAILFDFYKNCAISEATKF